ncbi:hypothetical protein M501DRAFT_1004965 [Patellaria atrata CBS 101060]|uniref:Uncharacterized protein n=1 Tax=Patellaria atrata CBS 101060 TaxID=1346257 RepID=A0A9P4VM20_9PEZI|nr:hypothetical protein M501DRAFT_1004965 [Patellaria atrata CBS 101060]
MDLSLESLRYPLKHHVPKDSSGPVVMHISWWVWTFQEQFVRGWERMTLRAESAY